MQINLSTVKISLCNIATTSDVDTTTLMLLGDEIKNNTMLFDDNSRRSDFSDSEHDKKEHTNQTIVDNDNTATASTVAAARKRNRSDVDESDDSIEKGNVCMY